MAFDEFATRFAIGNLCDTNVQKFFCLTEKWKKENNAVCLLTVSMLAESYAVLILISLDEYNSTTNAIKSLDTLSALHELMLVAHLS